MRFSDIHPIWYILILILIFFIINDLRTTDERFDNTALATVIHSGNLTNEQYNNDKKALKKYEK